MLLAIDVGNTQTHVGVFQEGELSRQWRASTDTSRTGDELALMLDQFLSMDGLSFQDVDGVCICSVVPRATQELVEMTRRYLHFDPIVVQPGIKTGVAIKIDNPREVGADRVANAVAAHSMFPGEPVIVVDFGTATTLDVVSSDGEYLGGSIAPGIDTAASGLYEATAQIRRVELRAPPTAIGRNTSAAVQSGLVYGTAGLVDGLVERSLKELGGHARVIATGGLARAIVEHTHTIERIEPTLTLVGLRLIFERNDEEED
jgi:type III pantothenate kinase